MKVSEELYDQIERFLSGDMNTNELNVFKELMANDVDLQSEVNLHKELQANLSDKPMDEYVVTLKELRPTIKDVRPVSKSFWKYLFGLGLLVLPLLIWYISSSSQDNDATSPLEKKSQDYPVINDRAELEKETKVLEKEIIEPVAKEELKTFEIPKSVIEDDEPSIDDLASVDFEPNKQLEYLIGNGSRGNSFNLKIKETQPNSIFSQNQPTRFHIEGVIDTKQSFKSSSFKVYIFNNTLEAFKNFQSLIDFEPSLAKIENGYQFISDKQIMLNPGLYYYIIEDSDTEEFLFVEKFEVRRK